MNRMDNYEILRAVETKLIRVTVEGKTMAQEVKGRSVIIPGFKQAGFFVYMNGNRWTCSESLCGLSLGFKERTASKAVASAIKQLWEHCHGDEEKFNEKLKGNPLVKTLPLWTED